MKRLLIIVAGFSVGIGLTAGVAMTGTKTQRQATTPSKSTITIRHQMKGCHAWSVNGGPYRASQQTVLARGGTITFVDNDVMPHKLIQTSGPKATLVTPAMSRMGATAKVVFPKKGTYTFVTKAGEDYPFAAGVKTLGRDNVLRLTVVIA